MSRNDALKYLKTRHPIANPNSGFLNQLDNFEKLLKNQNLI